MEQLSGKSVATQRPPSAEGVSIVSTVISMNIEDKSKGLEAELRAASRTAGFTSSTCDMAHTPGKPKQAHRHPNQTTWPTVTCWKRGRWADWPPARPPMG